MQHCFLVPCMSCSNTVRFGTKLVHEGCCGLLGQASDGAADSRTPEQGMAKDRSGGNFAKI